MYPRARIDALTDGVFAVAMTLLVLAVRLPEEFHPHDANELIAALRGLTSKFVPYAISFMVLGLRWLSTIQVRSRGESFGREYVVWWLFYLLLITCVPFSTIVVGRFGAFAPAILALRPPTPIDLTDCNDYSDITAYRSSDGQHHHSQSG
jgi:uncharacterized membrane protein